MDASDTDVVVAQYVRLVIGAVIVAPMIVGGFIAAMIVVVLTWW